MIALIVYRTLATGSLRSLDADSPTTFRLCYDQKM